MPQRHMGRLKRLKRARTAPARALDIPRGTHLWAYNYYRNQIVTSLLNDLIDRENEGLERPYCAKIQTSLGNFVRWTTDVPSGGYLGRNLYADVTEFANIYQRWNDIADNRNERRRLLAELRRKSDKIKKKAQRLQQELYDDLDEGMLTATYRVIGELVTMEPRLFTNLRKAYAEYAKKGAPA